MQIKSGPQGIQMPSIQIQADVDSLQIHPMAQNQETCTSDLGCHFFAKTEEMEPKFKLANCKFMSLELKE